jgi:hypothetical protein
MKGPIQMSCVGVAALIIGGIGGYIKGARDGSAYMSESVEQMALSQSAKETALYSQILERLRNGENQFVTDRMESLLDSAIINFGMFYKAEYDTNGWAGRSLIMARNYREAYPHSPSNAWSANMYKTALSLKVDLKSSQ